MILDDLTSQTIFEQSPISTQIFSPKGESLMANKAWEKLWGVKHKQALGYNVLQDKQLVQTGTMPYIKRGFAGETVNIPAIRYEPLKTVKIKGAVPYRYVKALIYPVKNASGKIIYVILHHEDVTDDIEYENKLQNSELRYKTLTSLAPVGIFQTDSDGNCLYVNKRWCEFAGLTPEQAKGKGWMKALHPDDRDRIFTEWYRAANQRQEFISEYRFKTKKGKVTWLQGNAIEIKDANGKTTGYLGTVSDITEKKITGEKLSFQANILNNITNSVVTTDLEGKITYWNKGAEHIFGYSETEMLRKDPMILYPNIDKKKFADDLQQITRGKDFIGEWQGKRKDGKYIWVDIKTTLLTDYQKKPIGYIGVANDITKRRQLEKQKDDFIGLVSHELKTPVTSIKVFTQVLEKSFVDKGDEKSAVLLKKMDVQIDKLTMLISDLLDVTRIEEGKLVFRKSRFDFNDLIREIKEEVQRTSERRIIKMRLEKTSFVYSDRERYGQVLTNLLTNALKYSPSSKEILITSKVIDKELSVSITDYGLGIPESRQKHIFERFYRVSDKNDTYPGLGLGLYITKEIVERQGGKIFVKSKVGKGSTFTFSVPLNREMRPQ